MAKPLIDSDVRLCPGADPARLADNRALPDGAGLLDRPPAGHRGPNPLKEL